MALDKETVNNIEKKHRENGFDVAVDCLILNDKKQVLSQKRSNERRLYPNSWDLPGGHIDEGDDLFKTIHKEIKEELDLEVVEIIDLFDEVEWIVPAEALREGENRNKIIVQFVIKCDLSTEIKLEEGKADSFDWFDMDNIEKLKENRIEKNPYIYNTIYKFLNSEMYKNL